MKYFYRNYAQNNVYMTKMTNMLMTWNSDIVSNKIYYAQILNFVIKLKKKRNKNTC